MLTLPPNNHCIAALDSSPSRELHRTISIHTPSLPSLEEDNKREKFLSGNQEVKNIRALMDLQRLFAIKSCLRASCVSKARASRTIHFPAETIPTYSSEELLES